MKKDVAFLGVPLDLGAGRRGVDMGPYAIRYAQAKEVAERLGYNVQDLGNVEVATPESFEILNPKLKYINEIRKVCTDVYDKVTHIVSQNQMPIILGGDHSLTIGSLAGVAKTISDVGVIWYDAHADMNTEATSPSGNIHGMSLAISLGYGEQSLVQLGGFTPKVKPENVVLIGSRDLDEGERNLIKKLGIHCFTMHEIDRLGMARVMEDAIEIVSKNTKAVHLSLDLDGLDPKDAPGVGTPVPGGLTYRESNLAMEMLSQANIITSVDFVEVNPILDQRNRTANTAVSLMAALLGERIL